MSQETGLTETATLTALIEPEAQALGFALVRVMMIGGESDPTLQVMAERPDTRQLTIEDCEALSRRLSDVLDSTDPIEGAYRLEVSSPGIDRPLTRLADYDDWAGHEARLRLAEPLAGRKQFQGKLLGRRDNNVLIDVERVGELSLPFADIASAKLVLTDALIKATAPLDASGADSIKMER